jgi:NADH-quinone oxidoreductase subunit M
MLTTFLIAWPLFSVLLVMVLGNGSAKWTAFLSSLVQLAVTLFAFFTFVPNAEVQFGMDYTWITKLGIHFNVGMDGISMLVVLLTNLVMPLILLSAARKSYEKPVLFFSLALIMQAALVGVFVARDMFLYYIFWELALIPIYLIVMIYGGANRVKITFKFFIYTMLGSLLMLVGILYLYYLTPGTHSFDVKALSAVNPDRVSQTWIFWAFFIAFAIKMPVFPFHTWQPDTYTTAPAQGTMLLSGIMLKMGIYSVIRWILPVVPLAVQGPEGKIALILSLIGIVYAAWIALTQKDMKRLFAYSSISHVGLISAAIFSLTVVGLQGSMIQMLSHGINIVGFFFIAQIIYDRTGTFQLPDMGGLMKKAPLLAGFFMIILLGSVGLPLTNGFVGELMMLKGVYEVSPWISAIAGLTIILSAVYMFRNYQASMLGELNPALENFEDLKTSEAVVLGVISILVIVIGVYPKPLLDMTEPSITAILNTVTHHNLTLK